MALGARFRNTWKKSPPRQLTPEQWQWEQQRRAVTSGVLHAVGMILLWSTVAMMCMAVVLATIMWTP